MIKTFILLITSLLNIQLASGGMAWRADVCLLSRSVKRSFKNSGKKRIRLRKKKGERGKD